MLTAINIKTENWNSIIESLRKEKWKYDYKYNGFDAGIDFDLIVLKKGEEKIIFGWNNWFEGELQCSKERMKEFEGLMNCRFEIGEPESLVPLVLKMYLK